MTDRERQMLFFRFAEMEGELEAFAEGRVVDGDPATVEGELLDEQERIEHDFGASGLSGARRSEV